MEARFQGEEVVPFAADVSSFIVEVVQKTTNRGILIPHFEEVRGGVEPWLMARRKARVEFVLNFK